MVLPVLTNCQNSIAAIFQFPMKFKNRSMIYTAGIIAFISMRYMSPFSASLKQFSFPMASTFVVILLNIAKIS